MTYLQLYQAAVADFIEFLVIRKATNESTQRKTPVFGSAEGQFQMSPDFDAPLDDFADYQ